MYLRYVDNIKENKLDFVTRGYTRYITLILILVVVSAAGATFAVFLAGGDLVKIAGIIFCDVIVTSFVASFPLYRLIYIVNASEFQNTILSSSVKTLTEFYLIVRENLSLVYKDARFDSILKSKTDNRTNNWLDFFGDNAVFISSAIRSRSNTKFDFMGMTILVTKLARPVHYYILMAVPKQMEEVYEELFEINKIPIYRVCNDKLISYNKAFEDAVSSIGSTASDAEQNIHLLKDTIESLKRQLNFKVSYVNYSETINKQILCGMMTSTYLDFDEILNAPIPIASMNDVGDIIKSNNSFRKILDNGLKPLNVSDILKEDLSTYFSDENHKSVSIINATVSKNGNSIKLFLKKNQIGFTGYFIDFSEIKALEDELLHSQKLGAVGQLAGGISHDFNNILTAIIGFCDLILLEQCPTGSLYNDIMYIKQSANKGQNLIKQILAFSCKQRLDEKVVCANDIIISMEKFIKCILGDAINLDIIYGSDLWFIKIDIGQFEQVLINLVINSKDAIGNKSGVVKISTENISFESSLKIITGNINKEVPIGDYVIVKVEDTGSGISPETLKKIFDPFFSTKEINKGTGLGLSTVYGIITQMHGYVYVESKPDSYTRFNLLLPRNLDRFFNLSEEENGGEFAQSMNYKKILLIEDEKLIRDFLTRSLKTKGYEVITTESTDEIDEKFLYNNKDIELVISDVIMPNASGPEVVGKILEIVPNISVLFISGYSKDKINNLNYNFEFLGKPFNLDELVTKIQDIFAKRSMLIS